MQIMLVFVAQSYLTLGDPVDCSPPGSSVHGILQARILEWVAMPSSRDLPDPGMKPRSPTLQADSSPSESPGKPGVIISISKGTGPFWGLGGIPHQASTYELSSASLLGSVLFGVRDTADAS